MRVCVCEGVCVRVCVCEGMLREVLQLMLCAFVSQYFL